MSFKISSKFIVLNISVFSLVACLAILFFENYNSTDSVPPIYVSDILQNTLSVKQPLAEFPVRIKIKKIDVDAPVEYVGLTSGGEMGVPKNQNNAGWFDLGVRPGDIGSAVIAGHYGWKDNIPSVFDDLSKLKVGDEISTIDTNGATTTFIVREVGLYKSTGDAANVFGSNDGLAHLNLITCEGVWNASKKSYSNRLIVFTDKKVN